MRRDGQRCAAQALPGDQHCFFHSTKAEHVRQRKRGRRKGGTKSHIPLIALPAETPDAITGGGGVLVAAGPHVDTTSFPETARLVDLAPTILAAVEAGSSVQHAGHALRAVVGEAKAVAAGASPSAAEEEGPGLGLDDTEADEVEEHLRGLGYIE